MMKLVGFALYNYAYAARKGLKLTLDHVYVTEKYRSLDIERNLYEVFIQVHLSITLYFLCNVEMNKILRWNKDIGRVVPSVVNWSP